MFPLVGPTDVQRILLSFNIFIFGPSTLALLPFTIAYNVEQIPRVHIIA